METTSVSESNKSNKLKDAIRACDMCQKRKTRCYFVCDGICEKCIERNSSCTFNNPVKKRGPKPKLKMDSNNKIIKTSKPKGRPKKNSLNLSVNTQKASDRILPINPLESPITPTFNLFQTKRLDSNLNELNSLTSTTTTTTTTTTATTAANLLLLPNDNNLINYNNNSNNLIFDPISLIMQSYPLNIIKNKDYINHLNLSLQRFALNIPNFNMEYNNLIIEFLITIYPTILLNSEPNLLPTYQELLSALEDNSIIQILRLKHLFYLMIAYNYFWMSNQLAQFSYISFPDPITLLKIQDSSQKSLQFQTLALNRPIPPEVDHNKLDRLFITLVNVLESGVIPLV